MVASWCACRRSAQETKIAQLPQLKLPNLQLATVMWNFNLSFFPVFFLLFIFSFLYLFLKDFKLPFLERETVWYRKKMFGKTLGAFTKLSQAT